MAEIKYVDWDGLVYYDGKSKQYIESKFDLALKYAGEYTFDTVPAPGFDSINFTYKITDTFTVSPGSLLFVDSCKNHTYAAGTVIIVESIDDRYMFNVLFEAVDSTIVTPGELQPENYYTKLEVDELLSGKVTFSELQNYYTKNELDPVLASKLNNSDLEGYATEEFVTTAIKAIKIPDEYVTEEELQAKDFATKDDLAAYAKDEDLNTVSLNVEELGKNITKNTADIETLDDAVANNTGAVEALRGEVTEVSEKVTDLQEAVNNISIPNNYVTYEELEAKGYITEHQDISGKADVDHKHTLADIEDYSSVNLEPYALKTDIPSIEGLATETFVKNAIAEAELNDKEVDLTGYATKDELSAVEAKIPSVEGLATETFVTESINNIQPTDLSNYYNKTETENLVDDTVKAIIVPEVPTNVSDFTNDANYTTLAEVATQGYLTSIPDEYVTADELAQEGFLKEHQSLEGYVKDAELTDAIDAVEHKIVTKTSELENDAEFVTASTLPAFVKPDDITDFVTLTEVEEAGFIKSIPDEYITETELADRQFVTEESLSQKGFITDVSNKADKDHTHSYNDLTDLPTIPSVEGLATKDYVDEVVANIDAPAVDTTNLLTKDEANTLLATKANDVPFADDYRVGTDLGGFVADESLQGMTVVQILTKLLGLTKYVAPEVPGGSSEVVEEIITNQATIYSQDESGNLVETEFINNTWTEAEAAPQMNGVSTFYQIVNDEGTVIESGYQEATTYNEEAWLTIALPDYIESFTVKQYDGLRNGWYEVNFVFEKAAEQTMDGYIIWTVPEKYEVMSGSTYRFVIE